MRTGFCCGNMKERTVRIPRRRLKNKIKICLQKLGWQDVDWNHLAQDIDKWCDFITAVRNLGVSKMRKIFVQVRKHLFPLKQVRATLVSEVSTVVIILLLVART